MYIVYVYTHRSRTLNNKRRGCYLIVRELLMRANTVVIYCIICVDNF